MTLGVSCILNDKDDTIMRIANLHDYINDIERLYIDIFVACDVMGEGIKIDQFGVYPSIKKLSETPSCKIIA